MGTVQTRRIQTSDIAGTQSCNNALLAPWQETTLNNTCAIEIASRYQWYWEIFFSLFTLKVKSFY
jgi:hypothetical protein